MRRFPPSHLFLVAVILIGMCSVVVAKFRDPVDDRFAADNVRFDLPLPALEVTPGDAQELIAATADTAIAFAPTRVEPHEPAPEFEERVVKVKPGDNLSLIFGRVDLTAADLQRVLASGPLAKKLARIYPGHKLAFSLDAEGQLVKLTYSPGPLEALEFTRAGERFESHEVVHQPDRMRTYKYGRIEHSLFTASQRAGLSDDLTMRLAQIFQWDVDFVLDIRKGDEFHVVYEEKYLNGEFVGNGEILAAEFVNQGDSYRAVRYTTLDDSTGYYAPDGSSLRKAFLRAPVSFSRISSNFNLRRVHPLFKRAMPHRGIDYAAPAGTPIMASGDGKVITASRTKPNGNFVVIKHGEQFQTKYLHLSKFARGVRSGARVKQGQIIGYVGATGWATAPHLHYEFLVNGVHKNPRTVALPKALPVPSAEKERFGKHAQRLASVLQTFKEQNWQLAAAAR